MNRRKRMAKTKNVSRDRSYMSVNSRPTRAVFLAAMCARGVTSIDVLFYNVFTSTVRQRPFTSKHACRCLQCARHARFFMK